MRVQSACSTNNLGNFDYCMNLRMFAEQVTPGIARQQIAIIFTHAD
jgi:hypothetical protein